jgi:hypothetical protein
MRIQATIAALTSVASGFLMPRQSNETAPAKPNVAAAQYDGLANQLYTERHPDYHQYLFLPRTRPQVQPRSLPRNLVPSRWHSFWPHRRRQLRDCQLRVECLLRLIQLSRSQLIGK